MINNYQEFLNENKNSKFKEHDVVYLLEELPDVKKGTKGSIVHIYNDNSYEVEFIVKDKSILKTLNKEQILKKLK